MSNLLTILKYLDKVLWLEFTTVSIKVGMFSVIKIEAESDNLLNTENQYLKKYRHIALYILLDIILVKLN